MNLLEGPGAAPGEGITIGIFDTGIDVEHPMFEGKYVYEEFLLGAEDELGDDYSHGTAVASVAAGGKTGDPNAPLGVAWGADLAVWAIPLGSGDGVYRPVTLEQLAAADESTADEFRHIINWRDGDRQLDILNMSFGYPGLISQYTEEDLRANFSRAIAALAQEGREDKTILVWSAGNSNGDRCGFGTPDCVDGRLDAVSASVFPRARHLHGGTAGTHRRGGGDPGVRRGARGLLEPLWHRGRLLHRGAGGGRRGRLLRAARR